MIINRKFKFLEIRGRIKDIGTLIRMNIRNREILKRTTRTLMRKPRSITRHETKPRTSRNKRQT